ncbi:hypothetical protein EVAR_51562_1 [Eumeta japonica]|uniref:Uncharacterized protein n=1 Tax=Eumeta variegata TaxID=151549 RepID=A0A4C1YIZ1_EUMVA|nr:hypothetical protein EVAR_51562_1 [Eumeta japonica]
MKHHARRLFRTGLRGRVNFNDEFRDDRPSTAVNNKNADALRHMIETDRYVTTCHDVRASLEILSASYVSHYAAGPDKAVILLPVKLFSNVTSRIGSFWFNVFSVQPRAVMTLWSNALLSNRAGAGFDPDLRLGSELPSLGVEERLRLSSPPRCQSPDPVA